MSLIEEIFSKDYANEGFKESFMKLKWINLVITLSLILSVSSCGYNSLQSLDESVKQAWSEVVNQYQRRADLIPNLVNTVKGYATHEEKVLTEVTEARSKVGSVQVDTNATSDEDTLKKFVSAQGELTNALSRLIAVSENYPNLKADENFRALQSQLEGTENRIAVARNRYIESVKDYNVTVRSFPSNLTAKVFGFSQKPAFTVEDEKAVSKPPVVDFQK